jgi:maleate isomerase
VTKEELAAMDDQSNRCATELADARVDVMGNACLVAIMSRGRGYHRQSEERLAHAAAESGRAIPIVSSAGALIEGLHAIGAKRISVITPYLRPLTELVLDYLRAEGIAVIDSISLEIADNLAVGARDPLALADLVKGLKIEGADAIVLSACVQMPSLAAIPIVQARVPIPVLSAAVATTWRMLKVLGLEPIVPDAGALLSGNYA